MVGVYVCMVTCLFVRMLVCLWGCTGCMVVLVVLVVWVYVCNLWSCMFACLYGCMLACLYGCMLACLYSCMLACLYGCMLACLLFYAFPCCFLLIIRRRFARWLSHICHWLCSCLFACVLTFVPLVISRKCHIWFVCLCVMCVDICACLLDRCILLFF